MKARPRGRGARGRRASRGFTLIELMVTIAVLAILLAIAVPSFTEASLGSKLGSHANALVASTNLARGEAIKRNSAVRLCVSPDGSSCGTGGWQQGWIVLQVSSGEVLLRQQALPSGFRVIAASDFTGIDFPPTGIGVTFQSATPADATLTVCRASPSVGSQERVVSIAATGRASVRRTTAGACG